MASLTFRVNDQTKERFDRLVDELGLNRSHVLRDAISGKLQELEALVEQHRPRRRRRPQTGAPVEAVLREVQRFPEVEKAYLFGSRAQGDAGTMSDVDIALSCPKHRPETLGGHCRGRTGCRDVAGCGSDLVGGSFQQFAG